MRQRANTDGCVVITLETLAYRPHRPHSAPGEFDADKEPKKRWPGLLRKMSSSDKSKKKNGYKLLQGSYSTWKTLNNHSTRGKPGGKIMKFCYF